MSLARPLIASLKMVFHVWRHRALPALLFAGELVPVDGREVALLTCLVDGLGQAGWLMQFPRLLDFQEFL